MPTVHEAVLLLLLPRCGRAAYVTRRLRFGFGLSWWTLRRCNKVRLHAHTHQHRDTPKLFVLAGTPLPNMITARIIALFNVQGALEAIKSRCHHQKGTERTVLSAGLL